MIFVLVELYSFIYFSSVMEISHINKKKKDKNSTLGSYLVVMGR